MLKRIKKKVLGKVCNKCEQIILLLGVLVFIVARRGNEVEYETTLVRFHGLGGRV